MGDVLYREGTDATADDRRGRGRRGRPRLAAALPRGRRRATPPRRSGTRTWRSTSPDGGPRARPVATGTRSTASRCVPRPDGRSSARSPRSTAPAAPRCSSSAAARAASSTCPAVTGIVADLRPRARRDRRRRGRARPRRATRGRRRTSVRATAGRSRRRSREAPAQRPKGTAPVRKPRRRDAAPPAQDPATPPARPTPDAARDRRPDPLPGDGRGAARARASPARIQEHGLADDPRPRPARVGPRAPPHRRRLHRTAGERGWSCGRSRSPPRSTRCAGPDSTVILLDPAGEVFRQAAAPRARAARRTSSSSARATRASTSGSASLVDLELSIGDYVLTGGELPALVVIDAVHPAAAGRHRRRVDGRGVVRRRPARVPAVHPPGRRSAGMDVPPILVVGRPRRGPPLAPERVAAADAGAPPGPAADAALDARSERCRPPDEAGRGRARAGATA